MWCFWASDAWSCESFPTPPQGPGEVVLAIKASGMCGSDLKFYRARGGAAALGLRGGEGPVIAGHEPCGVVVAVGPGVSEAQARPGQRVMVHHYQGCGVCNHCRSGWTQLCREGAVVYGATGHGAHAPYMKVPASTLVPLPDALSFAAGAAISCGTGTAYGALRRLRLSGHDTLAIFGQGPVGLSATLLAKAMGARVIAVDISDERLGLAASFGADVTLNPQQVDPVAAIKDLTHGEGADLSLDCSGTAEGRLAAVRSTRTWGTVGLVGEGGTVTLDVSQDLIRKQLTLVASWTFSIVGQSECARFIAERQVPVDRLFTHHFRLEQAEEAYRLFDTQTTGKGVFLF
ncbi:MAG: oxidoreductase [Candidatus Tectimicrobiota bacterium]|nr:MAG: oxidoreductase [Candidatus Tectomicrobia bacterium]